MWHALLIMAVVAIVIAVAVVIGLSYWSPPRRSNRRDAPDDLVVDAAAHAVVDAVALDRCHHVESHDADLDD